MCDAKKKSVKEFYGNLKTEDFSESLNETLQACNRPKNALPKKVREALKNVHDEVQNRYFGCGLCIPPALEGATVLDLGCGAGLFLSFLKRNNTNKFRKGCFCNFSARRRIWKSHRS